jgi:peptide/nickel transport system permease protein
VGAGIATLLVATLLIFLATNALPGNAAQVALGRNATPAQVAALATRLDLNQPLPSRYVSWLGHLLQGDLGQSATALAQGASSAPVSKVLWPAMRNTAVLALATIILLVPSALFLGSLAAVRVSRATDYVISYTALIFASVPEFVVGIFLIAIFFAKLNLFPPVALVPQGTSPLANPNELVLPVLTLLCAVLAFCARQVRAGMLKTLRQDYVRMARLNGIPEVRVIRRYALRNALAPSVQTFAQAFQYLFGGIVVVEALFAYPGVGTLLVNAVEARDLTLVAAVSVVLAAIFIGVNIAADVIAVLLVPKLRTGMR